MKTPRPRARLRTLLPALGLCLLTALPSPLAAAQVETVAPDVELGCRHREYGPGGGYVNGRHPAYGNWEDGCGGNGCDDTVYGSLWFGGRSHTFVVREGYRVNSRDCVVRCLIDAEGYQGRRDFLGNVFPRADRVSFECFGWFSGTLTTEHLVAALEETAQEADPDASVGLPAPATRDP